MTADEEPNSILIVWDASTGKPIKIFETSHLGGIKAMNINQEGDKIVILSAVKQKKQSIMILDWKRGEDCVIKRVDFQVNHSN